MNDRDATDSPRAVAEHDRVRPVGLPSWSAGLIAWAASAAIAFRSSLLSGFDLVSGNVGDGRLIAYLHEHLYAALRGRAELLSPSFYFPQRNVLGYTDAFLLDALPYSALRVVGLDPFLAAQALAIALSLACFGATLVICRRYLRLTPALAVGAAVLITFPNNLMFKTAEAHPNFFALYDVPCIVLLALWAIEAFPRPTRWSLARAGIAGLLYGLLFATSFYVAWLFALTLLFGLGTIALMRRGETLALLRQHPRPCGALAAAAAAGFVIGIVPLLMIYLPALQQQSGRSFRDYISFAPFPKDLLNVGTSNGAWGWLVDRSLGDVPHERALAVTPVMTACLLILLVRLRRIAGPAVRTPWPVVFGAACAAVWALSWLATMRIGTFSPFWLAYHIIPGSVAIRAGGRIQLLVNLWVVLGLAVLLQHWIDTTASGRRRARQVIAGLVVAVCLAEQISLQPANLPRHAELERLAAVPPPPAACRAFVVDAGRPPHDALRNWDAMWISMRVGLPTINGDSGWTPPGWRLNDADIRYDEAVLAWITHTGLTQQLCLYQRDTRRWSLLDFEAPAPPPTSPALQPTARAGPQID
ncbi:MAG: hypothetical protein HZA66_18395 [Rhodopseudomonas palustris]|uniref:Uncharacterized protein n=1 Tax=Rhodopseudomonas palustris TaxID=1076 RepID=A0A933S080_RHOPL|nr:hypothetical protein [Rhodopseudomonas palustris]